MVRFRANRYIIAMLVAALLCVQPTTRHIHLSQTHTHGDLEHKHEAMAHGHSALTHHADAIDAAHSEHHYSLIEIGDDERAAGFDITPKRLAAPHFVSLVFSPRPARSYPLRTNPLVVPFRYFERSSVRLRAPPLSS